MREQQIAVAVVVGDSLFCEPRLCGKSIVMHTHTHTRTNNKKSILGSKGLEAERPVGELGDISLSLWGDWTSHGKGASKLLAAGATGGSRCARGLLLGLLEQVACKVRLLNVVFNVVHRRGVLWTQVEKMMTPVGRKANWLNVSLIVIELSLLATTSIISTLMLILIFHLSPSLS